MSTSIKCSVATRGKAPARNQNDAPDIPRFRDAKAAENYMKSLPRKVASTKFVCKSTHISLGVLEGVTKLFCNIMWENLLNLMAHTYELHTRDFIADCGLDNEKKIVAFQLLGDQRYIDFTTINDILGLLSSNTSTVFDVLPAEFNNETFWMEITGGIFSCAGWDKATPIIHPCLHIAHRILVCTVFSRKEVGQVIKNELFFLWCMTRRENPPTPDFASFFFYKCALMRTKASGDICISGFVTLLACGLDIELPDEYQPVDNKTLLDERALTNMHYIFRRSRSNFTWYCPQGGGYLALPDPRVSNLIPHDRTQWRLARTITQSVNEDALQVQDGVEMHTDEESNDEPTHGPQQAQPQAPPRYYPLPPNVTERFKTLCVSNQIMSQQMHHMWEWHQLQKRFENVTLPLPYPYPPPIHPYPPPPYPQYPYPTPDPHV
ncbi:unnamed protein product [Lactuca saligna]|uniref:Arabidopsis retrotransposon Orf1 C-terminal domain-containing protein n=1 Tax=Lactuca saligna TaxID=75948 RepID=A0AA35Z7R3_LACSI|nr:unnamed protein product [Lactuca saligna]